MSLGRLGFGRLATHGRDALRIENLGILPDGTLFPSDVVLGHHPPILMEQEVAMLYHVTGELIGLEAEGHVNTLVVGELEYVMPLG